MNFNYFKPNFIKLGLSQVRLMLELLENMVLSFLQQFRFIPDKKRILLCKYMINRSIQMSVPRQWSHLLSLQTPKVSHVIQTPRVTHKKYSIEVVIIT